MSRVALSHSFLHLNRGSVLCSCIYPCSDYRLGDHPPRPRSQTPPWKLLLTPPPSSPAVFFFFSPPVKNLEERSSHLGFPSLRLTMFRKEPIQKRRETASSDGQKFSLVSPSTRLLTPKCSPAQLEL